MTRPLLLVATAVSLALASLTALAVGEVTVGNTTIVVRTVTGLFSENLRQLALKDDIYHNEVIETGADSASEIIFLDETTLSLGPDSRVTLDRFVFDPDPSRSAFVMTAAKGVMRFISGNLPTENYVIHTPVSTIGIRGTKILIVVLPDGTTNITIEDGFAEAFNCVGVRVDLNAPGMSTTITSRRDGTCSEPSIPGPQPPEFAAAVDGMDLTLLVGIPPGAGEPAGGAPLIIFPEEPLAENPSQVVKLGESIKSIQAGKFLEALIREEIRQDEDWVIRLRSLPDSPETYYLMELLASHDFQTGLQNYLDLADLRRKLLAWQSGFDSFDDMVAIRHGHFEPLLPSVDKEFREYDSRMRLRIEQHKMLVKRRDDMLTTPRPEFLATREEMAILARIEHLESQLRTTDSAFESGLQQRLERHKGTLTWTLRTEYHERLSEFDKNLRSLDEAMAFAHEQYNQYVRTRQAATHSYVGYETPISRLRTRVADSIERIDRLMARQGQLLESVAIEELNARRSRLESYRDKARFALADSYDRATQAQATRIKP